MPKLLTNIQTDPNSPNLPASIPLLFLNNLLPKAPHNPQLFSIESHRQIRLLRRFLLCSNQLVTVGYALLIDVRCASPSSSFRQRRNSLVSHCASISSSSPPSTMPRDYYRNVMGRKAWCVGLASFKTTHFVIYVCFGSVANISETQLREIAKGLEALGLQFIWVVRSHRKGSENEWLPEGFEARIEGKGLIIRGWAPQITNHIFKLVNDDGLSYGFVAIEFNTLMDVEFKDINGNYLGLVSSEVTDL